MYILSCLRIGTGTVVLMTEYIIDDMILVVIITLVVVITDSDIQSVYRINIGRFVLMCGKLTH